jgi:hypothetical protein
MVPRAMTTIVQEGIEPMLIGTHLLQRIQYKSGMTCRGGRNGLLCRSSTATLTTHRASVQPGHVPGCIRRSQ